MDERETITSRVLTAIEDAQLEADRAGQEGVVLALRGVALEVLEWQLEADRMVYKIRKGKPAQTSQPEPPDPVNPTPWFARREREHAELREAHIIDLDAYRQKRAAA